MAGEVVGMEEGKNGHLIGGVAVVTGFRKQLVAMLEGSNNVTKEQGHHNDAPPPADQRDVLVHAFRVSKHVARRLVVQEDIRGSRAVEVGEDLA
jgi:hypothetical protein